MGKIIPFQEKQQSLDSLTNALLSSIKEGNFSQTSSYSKGIIKYLETSSVDDINAFLISIAPLVASMDWKRDDTPAQTNKGITYEQIYERNKVVSDLLVMQVERQPQLLKFRNDIYNQLFSDDRFLDKIYELVPARKEFSQRYSEMKRAVLGKTDASNIDVQDFIYQCFKTVISKHGLLEQLMCIDLFSYSYFSLARELSEKVVRNLLKKYPIKSSATVKIRHIFEKLVEKNLSSRFRNEELDFIDSYRLLILRHRLKKECNDVCDSLIYAVHKTDFTDILRAFESDTDFSSCNMEEITYTPKYSKETSEFHYDLYVALHDAGKFNDDLAFDAVLFFGSNRDLESCPIGLLILGAIYQMDETPGDESSALAVEEFFAAGKFYFEKSLYEEAIACFKTALFNSIFLFGIELREGFDMSYYKEVTRKFNSYEKSINFLSKFRLISEYGFPMDKGLMNEIEITKAELEHEYETSKHHTIDNFYELVAKEDFPVIQSHLTKVKGQDKVSLTREQLQTLINKIQEKSEIMRGIKSMHAKQDMMMYTQRATYDKQAAILEAMNENKGSIEALINLTNHNTDKIIENIHRKNESYINQINIKTVEEYYYDEIGHRLWKKLDADTRKYLKLARHLDTTHQFSPIDEFGFIAIEFALAIENEFKRKIIDTYLGRVPQIKYKASDRIKIITQNTKITLGEICTLIGKARKVKNQTDSLWPFHNFILEHTVGKQKIIEFKSNLYKITNDYRNPAAHPSNYSRQLLDSFKALLFTDGFLKKCLEAIQIQSKDSTT